MTLVKKNFFRGDDQKWPSLESTIFSKYSRIYSTHAELIIQNDVEIDEVKWNHLMSIQAHSRQFSHETREREKTTNDIKDFTEHWNN